MSDDADRSSQIQMSLKNWIWQCDKMEIIAVLFKEYFREVMETKV